MKHVTFDIPHSLLVNGWCRRLISSIYDLEKLGSGEILVTYFSTEVKTRTRGNTTRLVLPSNGEKLLDLLSENNGLSLQSMHIKTGSSEENKSLKAVIKINDFEVIKSIAMIFADSLVEEQYGLDKQLRIFKDVLKEKYVEFENDELVIKWEDFPNDASKHTNLLKTLFYLENENYLDVSRFTFNLRAQQKADMPDGGYIWHDTVFGIYPMSLKVRIKQRLLTEWIKPEAFRDLTVSFNKATGILTVANRDYNFCLPDSIEADIMNLLVSNLNERVGHEKLALASWGFSDPQRLKNKIKELGGKTEVNRKNKIRVNDLRKKIKKFKLSKLLKITPCRGYKLQYTPNLQLTTSKNVELISENMPKDEEIPF